jgi:uncharacterized protein
MSGNLLQPFQPHALEQLEVFLKTHKTEDTLDLVGLNGFFIGIAHLPRAINPSEWLKVVITEEMLGKEPDRATEVIDSVLGYFNLVTLPIIMSRSDDLRISPYCDGSPQQTLSWLNGFAKAFSLEENSVSQLCLSSDKKIAAVGMLLLSHMLTVREIDRVTPILENHLKGFGHLLESIKPFLASTIHMIENATPENNLGFIIGTAHMIERELRGSRGVGTSVSVRREGPKVGRNDPCPCGSGLKYKKCHGK